MAGLVVGSAVGLEEELKLGIINVYFDSRYAMALLYSCISVARTTSGKTLSTKLNNL